MTRFAAILFDFDGVLVDTEMLHAAAWNTTLRPHQLSFTESEWRKNYIGRKDRDFLRELEKAHEHTLSETQTQHAIEEKIASYLALIHERVPVYPHVDETLEKLSRTHRLSLVTGSNLPEVEHIFALRGWGKYFQPVITARDVKFGKPDPEGYLKAVAALQLKPEDCVVVEDSPRGIQAAKNAGIYCIGITNNYAINDIPDADHHIASLRELPDLV